MGAVGDLTITKAKEHLDFLARQHAEILHRVEQARLRIHEFAPQTRDYELISQGLSLNEIDQEFYAACKKTADPHAMAARFGVDPEVVASWARQAAESNEARVIRMVVTKNEERASYAMGFGAGRQKNAEELLTRFRETLEKYGWVIESFGPAPSYQTDDVVLADA